MSKQMNPVPMPNSQAAANRREIAVALAQAGFSQAIIAGQLEVSQAAVSKMLRTAIKRGEFKGQGPHVIGIDTKVRGSHAHHVNPQLRITGTMDPYAAAALKRRKIRRRKPSS
jgi:predicted transcriptional regulator